MTVNDILKTNAKNAKRLFDLCDKMKEGVHKNFHIIKNSECSFEKEEYRVYHSGGYCFDVTKEKRELAEDEICISCIKGYEYSFNEELSAGFKEITVEKAIQLLK